MALFGRHETYQDAEERRARKELQARNDAQPTSPSPGTKASRYPTSRQSTTNSAAQKYGSSKDNASRNTTNPRERNRNEDAQTKKPTRIQESGRQPAPRQETAYEQTAPENGVRPSPSRDNYPSRDEKKGQYAKTSIDGPQTQPLDRTDDPKDRYGKPARAEGYMPLIEIEDELQQDATFAKAVKSDPRATQKPAETPSPVQDVEAKVRPGDNIDLAEMDPATRARHEEARDRAARAKEEIGGANRTTAANAKVLVRSAVVDQGFLKGTEQTIRQLGNDDNREINQENAQVIKEIGVDQQWIDPHLDLEKDQLQTYDQFKARVQANPSLFSKDDRERINKAESATSKVARKHGPPGIAALDANEHGAYANDRIFKEAIAAREYAMDPLHVPEIATLDTAMSMDGPDFRLKLQ